MPLLISSRMMSAGLTPSSSASSLTVIVPGSSIAPRSRGSSVWTPAPPNAPSRRGGLRGPRRPRVPLLLLATDSSFDRHRVIGLGRVRRDAAREPCPHVGWQRRLERPAQRALCKSGLEARSRPADVRTSPCRASGVVRDDVTGGGSNDTLEIALRANGPAGDAGPIRRSARRGRRRGPGYDATSSVGAAFFDARLGLAAAAASSGAGCSGAASGGVSGTAGSGPAPPAPGPAATDA